MPNPVAAQSLEAAGASPRLRPGEPRLRHDRGAGGFRRRRSDRRARSRRSGSASACERDGYNLYAMGPEGIGRHTIVRRYLEQRAPQRATPADWCYVFNFAAPDKPRALKLPAGQRAALQRDMERLVEDLRTGIPGAFETDEYRTRLQEIESEFEQRHESGDRRRWARRRKEQGIALVRTPAGFGFAPMHKDKVMEPGGVPRPVRGEAEEASRTPSASCRRSSRTSSRRCRRCAARRSARCASSTAR